MEPAIGDFAVVNVAAGTDWKGALALGGFFLHGLSARMSAASSSERLRTPTETVFCTYSRSRRQAQARWTQPICHEDLTLALSVEDARFIIDAPAALTGAPRSPSPDFVMRLRLDREWGQFQIAHLYRIGGFQPTGGRVETGSGWGFK